MDDDVSGDRASSRIDLDSGFMKQIIRNQQDRDDYDKEVKLQKEQMKHNPKAGRDNKNHAKRPEQGLYTPPIKGTNTKDGSCQSMAANGPPKDVFKLQYEDPDGEVSAWLVRKGDDPQKTAERFGRQCSLTVPLINALASIIEEEMLKKGLLGPR
ncbi:UPF0561 protein C2orf68 homolog [Diadema antillarum]|uniref:UPF0561 protein C2orf68 homolog n=1 Tax=Diadema antillarum TaxID=105358 RepID=UPI003A858B2F